MNDLKSQFLLDPSITYLNFGSFGACPKPVFDTYMRLARELEQEPVQFITKTGPALLALSRKALGDYIGCNSEDLVFTPNPTFAINIIARGLKLEAGDEILATDLEYGAMDRTWNFYCSERGAKYIRQPITLPVSTREAFVREFFKGCTEKTKAVFISQITSATALILPAHEICVEAKKRGLLTIVDGAHVPGHIPLDLRTLQADIYTGACHKWMMTPKGSSFLYVKPELQDRFDPLVISWGYESDNPSPSRFQDYHQFNGTRDFSAYLTIPAALEFMESNHWNAVRTDCCKLVLEHAERFYAIQDSQPLSPLTPEWIGQMLSIPVRTADPMALYRQLFDQYRIEIPVMQQNGQVFVRYSINGFNSAGDLDKLHEALLALLK